MSRKRAKVPPPPSVLDWSDHHLAAFEDELFRIYRTAGNYPVEWNTFREYGPVPTSRWDPHPLPSGIHPSHAIMYCACSLPTALAEAFQDARHVDLVANSPRLTIWKPSRPLTLLNLTSTSSWTLQNGAAHSLNSLQDIALSQEWARAIFAADIDDELDGLLVESTMTGYDSVVLFKPAEESLPVAPIADAPLAAQHARLLIKAAAKEIGYSVDG